MANESKSAEGKFLPYDINHIPDEFLLKAKSDIFETEENRVNGLKLLRSMLNEEPDMTYQDDDLFLLSFLRARKFDVQKAFTLFKAFYSKVRKRTELYEHFDFNDVSRILGDIRMGFLPYRDSDGCAIILFQGNTWNADSYNMGDIMRGLTVANLHANLFPMTQISGVKMILDLDNFTMKQLSQCTPTYLSLCAQTLQNCFPGRFKALHMVNENAIFFYIWTFLKQFLSKKMKNRFHFHGKNVTELHKYFSTSILPAEYGGELPPFDNSEWSKLVHQKSEYFSKVFSYPYENVKMKRQGRRNSRVLLGCG